MKCRPTPRNALGLKGTGTLYRISAVNEVPDLHAQKSGRSNANTAGCIARNVALIPKRSMESE